jgi:uncharacterized protein (DUF427 family)
LVIVRHLLDQHAFNTQRSDKDAVFSITRSCLRPPVMQTWDNKTAVLAGARGPIGEIALTQDQRERGFGAEPEPGNRSPGFARRPDYSIKLYPSPKRVRCILGQTTIVDSTRPLLLLEQGHMPVYYFPMEDVQIDLLRRTDHRTHCPYKGNASYWSADLGVQMHENLVWAYETPYEEMARISGHMAFYWNRFDQRLEEDEEVIGHPRDPFHRIDLRASRRRVQIVIAGETIADSDRALFLFETGLPTRYYLPPEDVRADLLEPSDKTTVCPYKGIASYWSVRIGGKRFENVVWSYLEPLPEKTRLKGLVAFAGEEVDGILIDGVPAAAREST